LVAASVTADCSQAHEPNGAQAATVRLLPNAIKAPLPLFTALEMGGGRAAAASQGDEDFSQVHATPV